MWACSLSGADVVPAPTASGTLRMRPALLRLEARRRERNALCAARWRAAKAVDGLPPLPLAAAPRASAARASSPSSSSSSSGFSPQLPAPCPRASVLAAACCAPLFTSSVLPCSSTSSSASSSPVLKQGRARPAAGPGLRGRKLAGSARQACHGRVSRRAKAGAGSCSEYASDWSSALSGFPAPPTFRERVQSVLCDVVPADWDGFDFHFDTCIRSGGRCPGQSGECFGDSRLLQCMRCQLIVCAACTHSHLFDHLSVFERATLRDDLEIGAAFSDVVSACVALV